jgi:hypothetical protein
MIKITKANYLLGLLGVIGICAAVLALRTQTHEPVTPSPTGAVARPVAEIRADWQAGVVRILSEYDRTQDAKAAEEGLLELRVAEGDRDLHLELVIAFQALTDSRAGGKGQLQAARTHFEGRETMLR